jgi:hypothetical protein
MCVGIRILAINLIPVVPGSTVEESVHYVSAVPIIESWDDDHGSLLVTRRQRERSLGTEEEREI